MSVKRLNAEQLQAVRHRQGPLLIIAGAGTGKTTVITERIKYLILKDLAQPSEILALTFTEKAAFQMQERVDQIMPYGYTQMWISTFHSFCEHLLRREAAYLGLSPTYTLMTEADAIQFFKKHLFKFPLRYFRPRGNPTKFLDGLLKHFSRLQDEDITPAQYLRWARRQLKKAQTSAEKDEAEKYLELASTYRRYQQLKFEQGFLDFADLISYALRLFRRRPHVLRRYQKQFKYILVDEFQDTNIAQNQLVVLLAGKKANLTVVADDDQAIYKWRGAAVSNVLQFKKTYPQAKVITLVKNYRSTQKILDHAYQLIQHNNPDRLEVKEKINKRLRSMRRVRGEAPRFILADRVENEADAVAQEIKKLVPSYQFKDIAILVRANNHAEPFVRSFLRHGIPFQFLGPGRLLRQEEIKELIAYLKVLANPQDDVAFYKVLTMEIFSLPARDLALLRSFGLKNNLSLFEAAEQADSPSLHLSSSGRQKLKKLIAMIHRHLKLVPRQTAGQILYYFVQDSGLLKALADPKSQKQAAQVQNIAKFFDQLKAYEAEHEDASVFSVVDWLTLKMELGESPLAADLDWTQNNAVNILTCHSAKGLEFPVVFLVNLVVDRFPTRHRQDQIPIPEALVKEVLPSGDSHLQEERRLFYVGLTRARDLVYLTASRYYGEAKRLKKLSPFIFETLGPQPQPFTQPQRQLSIFDFQPSPPPSPLPISHPSLITYLSYSQIDTFDRCPLQYYYRFVLRIPTPPSYNQSFGTSLHNALRDFYQLVKEKRRPGLKKLLQLLKQNWLSQGYFDKAHEKKSFAQAKDLLTRFYRLSFDPQVKPIALEEPFKLRLAPDFWIGGRIDRIDEKPDGSVEIIDYKTGRLFSQKEVDTSLQMTIYALAATSPALYRRDPSQVTLSFYFLETQQKLSTRRTAQDLSKAKQKLLEKRQQIAQSDFSPKTGPWCNFCDFRLLCPAWR